MAGGQQNTEAIGRRREEAIADGLDPDIAEEMWQRLMAAPESQRDMQEFLELTGGGEVSRDDAREGSERRIRPLLRSVVESVLKERGEI